VPVQGLTFDAEFCAKVAAKPERPAARHRRPEPPVYPAPAEDPAPRILAPRRTSEELYSEESFAEARRKFMGTAGASRA
jgi:hypothetical protein